MDLFIICLFLFGIYAIDKSCCSILGEVARWVQLHCVINIIVMYLSFSEMVEVFYEPLCSIELSSNKNVLLLITSLHVYHTMFFKLSMIDFFHHILSLFIWTPFALNLNIKLLSMSYFIGCGLPGAIDYGALTLVKHKKMNKLTEKYLNSLLNLYIRIPGGIIASYLFFIYHEYNYIMVLLSMTMYMNVLYFGQLAITNYWHHAHLL